MSSHFFAMLSRMKNIYRWGLMRNTKAESLSEHSLEVAFIAHALALIKNKRFGGSLNAEHIAVAAMFHDTSEIITGDMPTPVKYYNEEIKKVYKQIEAVADNTLIDMLPEDLKEDYLPLYTLDEEEKKIIKAADKISALIKCIEELNMGNREFETAEKSTREKLKELKAPEVDVFLDEFMGSFNLTLDELRC